MAFGEQSVARGRVAITIHVWPTQELIAQSWAWPERWRAAYQEMAWAISLAAATQVLEGGTFAHREIEVETEIGCAKFTISQIGTTVHIMVSEFFGPGAPGPDDGVDAQPHAIDGLVIGLRGGINRSFRAVVFYGSVPPIPCVSRFYSRSEFKIFYSMDRSRRHSVNVISELHQLVMNTPETGATAWARALLQDLEAYWDAAAKPRHHDPLDDEHVGTFGEAVAMREGVGISSFIWPEIDCSAAGVQGINLGVAPTERRHRKSQTPRQSSLDYQLQ